MVAVDIAHVLETSCASERNRGEGMEHAQRVMLMAWIQDPPSRHML